MSDYSVQWRSGERIVEDASILARTPLQAARKFAVGEELTIQISSHRAEGAAAVWSVMDGTGKAVGDLLVL